jgi:hypothetical protein
VATLTSTPSPEKPRYGLSIYTAHPPVFCVASSFTFLKCFTAIIILHEAVRRKGVLLNLIWIICVHIDKTRRKYTPKKSSSHEENCVWNVSLIRYCFWCSFDT